MLTPVGYLQFESGVLGANHSPEFSSRFGFNEVIKFSVTSHFDLLRFGGTQRITPQTGLPEPALPIFLQEPGQAVGNLSGGELRCP